MSPLTIPAVGFALLANLAVNVKDAPYSAVGDGVADDTAAIQAAIDAVTARGGGTVFFPRGDYGIVAGLNIQPDIAVRLLGEALPKINTAGAMGGARLRRLAGTNTIVSSIGTSFAVRSRISIEQMEIHGGNLAGVGVLIDRGHSIHFDRVRICNCGGATGLWLRGLFNSSFENIYISDCGNGAAAPAMLMDGHAEAQGASDTVQFANLEFESNNGTDLRLTGTATSGPTTSVQFVNTKLEGGRNAAAPCPYIDLDNAQRVQFVNTRISVHGDVDRTATPIIQGAGSVGSAAGNQFVNLTVDTSQTGGGNFPYVIQATRIALSLTNFTFISQSGNVTTALVRLENSMGADDFHCDWSTLNTNTNAANIPRLSDARAGHGTIASAATIAIPDQFDYYVISGATGITAITASWKGRKITLSFQNALVVTDGGNLTLAGNFPGGNNATLSLVCDGTNWLETARSIN